MFFVVTVILSSPCRACAMVQRERAPAAMRDRVSAPYSSDVKVYTAAIDSQLQ
jgi:hypothetical protein